MSKSGRQSNSRTGRPNAQAIVRLRKQKGWTQETLATAATLTKRTIERAEAGEPLLLASLSDIAAALDVDISAICEFELKPALFYMPDRNQNAHFIGRKSELDAIRNQLLNDGVAALTEAASLESSRRIAVLVGLGGIGKTQTAVEYAFRYRDQYSYVFFVHADDPGKIQRDYGVIARLLELVPREKGIDGLVQILLEWMQTHSGWLMIIDNVDRIEHVAPYLPKLAKGHILVTSRLRELRELNIGIAQPIELGFFQPAEARQLMQRIAAKDPGDATDEAALLKILGAIDGLPVALDQAAMYIRNVGCSYTDYWEEFRLRKMQLFAHSLARPFGHEGLLFSGHRDAAIVTTWDLNFRRVEQEAAMALETASAAAPDLLLVSAFLSPDDIPMDLLVSGAHELGPRVAQALGQKNRLAVNEALHLLHRYSLIELKVESRAFRMHRLVQEVIRKVWMSSEDQIVWAARVIALLARGTAIMNAGEGNWPSSLKDQHFANFVAAILLDELKSDSFEFESAAELLSQTGFLLTKSGQYKDAHRYLERALTIRKKVLGPTHVRVAQTLNYYANNFTEHHRSDEALQYYDQALSILLEEYGRDHNDVADVQNNLGIAYFNLGEDKKSELHYTEAARIWELNGSDNLVGHALFGIAMICERQDQRARAEEHYDRAHQKISAPVHSRAHLCFFYGRFLEGADRSPEAVKLFTEALELAKRAFGAKSDRLKKYERALEGARHRVNSR